MNSMITNYFDAEPAIIARRVALVPEVPEKNIFTPFDLQDMVQSSQPSPALHVVYAGDGPQSAGDNAAGQGTSSFVAQRWLVVLAMRNAKAQLQQTKEIRTTAGVIIPKVLGALQGWQPVTWMRPLRRVGGPSAGYSSSFAYFPFLFEGRIIT